LEKVNKLLPLENDLDNSVLATEAIVVGLFILLTCVCGCWVMFGRRKSPKAQVSELNEENKLKYYFYITFIFFFINFLTKFYKLFIPINSSIIIQNFYNIMYFIFIILYFYGYYFYIFRILFNNIILTILIFNILIYYGSQGYETTATENNQQPQDVEGGGINQQNSTTVKPTMANSKWYFLREKYLVFDFGENKLVGPFL
jgi:hypothetical protein